MRSALWTPQQFPRTSEEMEIDWSHPLAWGLTAFIVSTGPTLTTQRDLVRPRAMIRSGTAVGAPTPEGFHFQGSGGIYSSQNPATVTQYPYSVWSRSLRMGDGTACPFTAGDVSGNYEAGVYQQTDQWVAFFMWGGTYRTLAMGANTGARDGLWHSMGLAGVSATNHKAYKNGANLANSANDPGSTFSQTVAYCFGAARSSGTTPFLGIVSHGAIWDGRALTQDEWRWLTAEPNCLLKLRKRRTFGSFPTSPVVNSNYIWSRW